MSQSKSQKPDTSPNLISISKELYQIWITERPAQYAAALAYYSIFSIVPVIYITFLLADLLFTQLAIADWFYNEMATVLGVEAALFLQESVAEMAQSTASATTLASLISVISILLSASIIFMQLRQTLNAIWLVPTPSKVAVNVMLRNRLLPLIMLLGVFGFVSLAAVINFLVSFIASQIELNFIVYLLSFLVLVGLGTISLALFYKILPNAYVAWKFIWSGAAIAALLIALLIQLVGFFFSASRINSAIEASGATVVMLIFFYVLGQIFVLGAVLTRVFAKQNGEAISLISTESA